MSNKVEITMFECYKRETINNRGITHSSGDGRNMLMILLINLKKKYPQIIIIYLTADAFIHENSNKEHKRFFSKKRSYYQQKLEEYYRSIGFVNIIRKWLLNNYNDNDNKYYTEYNYFIGYIGYIIFSINNYANSMKKFNLINIPILESNIKNNKSVKQKQKNVIDTQFIFLEGQNINKSSLVLNKIIFNNYNNTNNNNNNNNRKKRKIIN